jgi:hypothetical protein
VRALAGFDWDRANRNKCQKHGVSVSEIVSLFTSPLLMIPDVAHSKSEARMRALGKSSTGRMVFLVFTVRLKGGRRLIRPIIAHYMHAKEIASYEKENPQL